MWDDIYIGKNQQTFKKIMDVHFTDILRLLKNGQKLDSFADHFKQHFTFKLVKQLKPIGSMKTFTKPN